MSFELIYDGEEEVAEYEITQRYVRKLEADDLRASRTLDVVAPPLETQTHECRSLKSSYSTGTARNTCAVSCRRVVAAAPAGVGVVVADNGSTDDSLAVLARRSSRPVAVLRLDRNYGFAGGYNRALEQVEADYYLLLNSDVETPRGVAGADPRRVWTANPDVAVVSPKLISCADRTEFEYAGACGRLSSTSWAIPSAGGASSMRVEADEGQYDDARDVFWVSGAAFCCRADVFRALGGFDGDFFAHMEEIDLCWRMQLAGYRVRVVPRSTVYHLGGGTLHDRFPDQGLLQPSQ